MGCLFGLGAIAAFLSGCVLLAVGVSQLGTPWSQIVGGALLVGLSVFLALIASDEL